MAAFGPDIIFTIGSFPVTNTVLNTLFVDAVLIGTAFYLKDHLTKIPGKFQSLIEMLIETFYNLTASIAGKNAEKIFPWFMSFFLFILIANWSGLLPGTGSIGYYPSETHTEEVAKEHAAGSEGAAAEESHGAEKAHLVPFFRNATSELNVTLALALISLVATHTLAIRAVGWKEYLSRYFSFNLILLFVGILEIVSEFTKIISLSFRLFGNIFAGEVVLHTISSLFAFIFPIPFMLLEVIVGLVQALVFAMLTMVFMSVLMTPHHAEEH